MPILDENGKQLSGAKKRALKKLADEKAQKQHAKRIKEQGVPTTTRIPLKYSDLPPPPYEEPEALVAWSSKVLAAVMEQTMFDPYIDEKERRKILLECCAKLGMIRDKAGEQNAIQKVLKAQTQQKEASGLTHARIPATPPISRPTR